MPRAPKYRVEATWQCFKESHDSMFGFIAQNLTAKDVDHFFQQYESGAKFGLCWKALISRWSFFDWFLWCQVCCLDIYCQIRLSLRTEGPSCRNKEAFHQLQGVCTVWSSKSMVPCSDIPDLMVQGRRSHISKKACVSSQAAEKTFRFYRWVWDVGRMAVRTRLSRSCAGSTGRAFDTWWDDVRCAHQKGGYFMIFQRRSLCWWNLWVTWLHLDAFCILNIEKTWAVTFWSNHVQCYFFI